MQLLPLIFLAFAHVLTSNADCSVLLITPTDFNGLIACGSGGIVAADCFCCPDLQTPCQSLLQVCSRGSGIGDICVNNPQYFGGSGCASQSLAACGTGCMPIDATCCSDQQSWCAAGSSCKAESDGRIHCVLNDLNSPSDGGSSPTTTSILSPSTTTNGGSASPAATSVLSPSTPPNGGSASPAATSVLSPSTPPNGGSASPAATSILSPSTPPNTASSSASATRTQSSSSVATRKGSSGISSLLAMLAMNVFIFS